VKSRSDTTSIGLLGGGALGLDALEPIDQLVELRLRGLLELLVQRPDVRLAVDRGQDRAIRA
jgi:hypothetical protein